MSDLKTYAKENHVPIIKDAGLAYLLATIQKYQAYQILELGTAIGYSAIQMAKLDPRIMIDTLERDPKMYHKAVGNIKDAQLSSQINAVLVDIKDYQTDKEYDLIFVDAAKGQYHNYLEQFYSNLKTGGLFVFDNLVFHDMIYNVEAIKNRNTRQLVKKIIKFRQNVQEDKRFDIILKDNIGDGVWILVKKEIQNEG